jgi:hypothetical protein
LWTKTDFTVSRIFSRQRKNKFTDSIF